MRIDSTHRGWFVGSMVFLVLLAISYVLYDRAYTEAGGTRGDSLPGLAYGIAGTLMIVFAALLGARKKVIRLRVGTLAWWLRGHLWLGLLSLPLILCHAAFAFGGPLTTWLMILLIVIVGSGLLGAALQHLMPNAMTSAIAVNESTYEHLKQTLAQLRLEAYELVWAGCGVNPGVGEEQGEITATTGADLERLRGPAKALSLKGKVPGQDILLRFYQEQVAPFLRSPSERGVPLAIGSRADLLFAELRTSVADDLHPHIEQLEIVCADAREKPRQIRYHRMLHGWLLVHIPLSMALLVLTAVHVVMALYY